MEFVLVGRIRKAQGVKGHVTVELLTDEPDVIFASGRRVFAGDAEGNLSPNPATPGNPESRHEIMIESSTPFKGGLIVKFNHLDDRNSAELWRSRYLLVPIDEVTPPEDGEVFVHDLVGMNVHDQSDTSLGVIVSTYELPQGLAIEVRVESGRTVLVPFRDEFILGVDSDNRRVKVDSSVGLFDL